MEIIHRIDTVSLEMTISLLFLFHHLTGLRSGVALGARYIRGPRRA